MNNLKSMLVRPFAFIGDSVNAIFAGLASENKLPFIIEGAVLAVFALAILLVLILPEPRRKLFVALKRKPQQIPLVVFAVAFVIYSFNLTAISDTTNLIQARNMGLTGFITMLCSTLLLMCCMNAFPYRKKVNKPMLILMLVMVGILLYCDYYYFSCVSTRMMQVRTDTAKVNDYAILAGNVLNAPETLPQSAAAVAAEVAKEFQHTPADFATYAGLSATAANSNIVTTDFVLTARNVVKLHAWILVIGLFLVVTLPVYRRLIRKIRTSIAIEGNEQMAAIDISGE